MKQTDKGIFLHRTAFSDSSLIVTYYTANHGLRKFVYKGGKKKAHQLFPMAPTELTFYGRQESDLLQLTATEALVATDFQFDPIKSSIAFFLAETVRKSVHEFDSDKHIFKFLLRTVEQLNNTDELAHFPLDFLIDFTETIGIQPLIQGDGDTFDVDDGSVGAYAPSNHQQFNGAIVTYLTKRIQGLQASLTKPQREECMQMMMHYYKSHVPGLREFETYTIVQEILS